MDQAKSTGEHSAEKSREQLFGTWYPIKDAPLPAQEHDPETSYLIGYTSWGQHVGKFHEHVGPCEYQTAIALGTGEIEWVWGFVNTDCDIFPPATHFMPWPPHRPSDDRSDATKRATRA